MADGMIARGNGRGAGGLFDSPPRAVAWGSEPPARARLEPADLEGQLDVCPLFDLVQALEKNARSGVLKVRSGGEPGLVRLLGGKLVNARFGRLRQGEALQALFELQAGSFRFLHGDEPAPPASGEGSKPLNLLGLSLEAAWLQDELERRAHHLPEPHQQLVAAPGAGAEGLPGGDMPYQEVMDTVRRFPGITLKHLLQRQIAAPLRLRLAVAWLVEEGRLAAESAAAVGAAGPPEPAAIPS